MALTALSREAIGFMHGSATPLEQQSLALVYIRPFLHISETACCDKQLNL